MNFDYNHKESSGLSFKKTEERDLLSLTEALTVRTIFVSQDKTYMLFIYSDDIKTILLCQSFNGQKQ